jgi:hypothetical protein
MKHTRRYYMNISGIGVLQAQLLQQQSSQQDPLGQILLNKAGAGTSITPYEKESIHMEIELKDGTKVSIDYEREGMIKKASYELGLYDNYTYGNDQFSPGNTANRILDFARSLWDGSEEKLDMLSKAIEKGIGEAKKTLGNIPDWLNNIISQTVDLVHKGIKDMKAQIQKAA